MPAGGDTHIPGDWQPQCPSVVGVPPGVCVFKRHGEPTDSSMMLLNGKLVRCTMVMITLPVTFSAFTFYHNMHKPPIGFPLAGSFLTHNNPAGRGAPHPAWMREGQLLAHLTLLSHGNLINKGDF